MVIREVKYPLGTMGRGMTVLEYRSCRTRERVSRVVYTMIVEDER